MNQYILLYPSISSNTGNVPMTENQNDVTQFEEAPTDARDETRDGDDGSFEEGAGDFGGDSDFWQSFIDYFGICNGSRKTFRLIIPKHILNVDGAINHSTSEKQAEKEVIQAKPFNVFYRKIPGKSQFFYYYSHA